MFGFARCFVAISCTPLDEVEGGRGGESAAPTPPSTTTSTFSTPCYTFEGGPFDTIAHFCNGLDKVGRLALLPRFLDRMRHLLAPGGVLVADSFDVRVGADATRLAELSTRQAAGRYFGEMDLRFEYKGRSGAAFSVLQVDYPTFARIAGEHGWMCALVERMGGHYLACARPI